MLLEEIEEKGYQLRLNLNTLEKNKESLRKLQACFDREGGDINVASKIKIQRPSEADFDSFELPGNDFDGAEAQLARLEKLNEKLRKFIVKNFKIEELL